MASVMGGGRVVVVEGSGSGFGSGSGLAEQWEGFFLAQHFW